MRRRRRQPERVQSCDQLVELVVGHVEDDQLLVRREADPVRTRRLGEIGDLGQDRAGHAARDRRDADGVLSVLELLHADVVDRVLDRLGRGSVDQLAAQVLVLEDLAELLDAPVLDQELQPRLRPQPPVAVVAEHRRHGLPDVGHLVQRHPGAEPLGQHRVGGQAAADPHVQTGAVLGVVDADERDVVDLVGDVLQARDRGLVLARQVGELRIADVAPHDLVDRPGRVEHLVERFAGQRRAQHHAGAVAAGLGGLQADRGQPIPDLRHVLDPDPVVLDVLAVGDVGGVAGELGGDLAERAQRGRGQRPAVAAHPHHEVLGLEDVGVLVAGPGAVVALLALGVEAPSSASGRADPACRCCRSPAWSRCSSMRARTFSGVVVLLELFVRVERLAIAELPLALAAWALGGLRLGGGH